MRHFIAIALVPFLFFSCGPEAAKRTSAFELKGKLTNSNAETIYLEKLASQKPEVVDSTTVAEDGSFSFDRYSPEIGFYRIKINEQNFAMLVLDSVDKVTVNGNAKDMGNTYKVEGSPETKLFLEFNELAKTNRSRMDSLRQAYESLMHSFPKMDSLRMDSLSKLFEGPYKGIMENFGALVAEKIKGNLNMFSSIMAVQSLDPDKYGDIYKALDVELMKKFPGNKAIIMYHDAIGRLISSKAGEVAPEINLPDPNGKNIALSSLKGKVVLIDFWASWCGPCRREMPNVVAAYKKFKPKGFEIYGVSLDQDMGKWVEAIKMDGITWPQVSDLKWWDCAAAKLYNVQAIPYTVLLDREGKIVGKNLRGPQLEQKLEEMFSKNP